MENEKSCRSSIHGYLKKMMDELDKLQPCTLCGKERGIGVTFCSDKEFICVSCLNVLVDNVDEIDDKVSKALGKARQK